MCEIFIIDPKNNENELIEANASDMFDKNPDGIGLVAIDRDEDNWEFEYRTWKSAGYNSEKVMDFIEAEEDAWRLIVHARLATCGETNAAQAHPIMMDCEECDVSAVIHNGVVSNDQTWYNVLIEEGHNFRTEVDSEVIAHEHNHIPQDIDEMEEPELSGSLNYILLQKDAILVRSGSRYKDAESLKMGKTTRIEWDEELSSGTRWRLVTPDGEIQDEDARSSYRQGNGSRYWTGYGPTSRNYNTQKGGCPSPNGDGEEDSDNPTQLPANDWNRGASDNDDSPSRSYQRWEDWPPEDQEAS